MALENFIHLEQSKMLSNLSKQHFNYKPNRKDGKDMKYIVMVDGFEEAEFNNKIDTIRFIMQMVKYAKADRDSITIWDSEGHEVLQGVVR